MKCKDCGSEKTQKHGTITKTDKKKYQRYHCRHCGITWTDEKPITEESL